MMFMSIFWVPILAIGVFMLIKSLSNSKKFDGSRGWFGSNPLEVLKERYARGELNRAEFERMKRDLEGVG